MKTAGQHKISIIRVLEINAELPARPEAALAAHSLGLPIILRNVAAVERGRHFALPRSQAWKEKRGTIPPLPNTMTHTTMSVEYLGSELENLRDPDIQNEGACND
jgi:hypothetical protein